MLRRISILFISAIVTVSSAFSQQPRAFGPADKSDVEKVVRSYFQAFTEKNYDQIRDLFQAPFVSFGGQGSVLSSSLEDAVKNYQKIRESLNATDYAASKAVEMRITALNNDSALVNIHWQRFKKDGSLLNEGSEFQIVSKASGKWKICGSMGQNLPDFGKQY